MRFQRYNYAAVEGIVFLLLYVCQVHAQSNPITTWFDAPVADSFAGGDVALGSQKERRDLVKLTPIPKDAPLISNSLSQIIGAGLASNPAVQNKSKLADSAKYGIDIAKWQFYPTPSASIQQAHTAKNDPSYQGANRVMQLGLQQPIWTGGRLSAGLSLSEKQLIVALAELEGSKEQVALRIVNAFAGWVSANDKVIAYQINVANHRDLQALIRRRIDAGLSPESDYIFSAGRFDQALADLEAARAQKSNALTSLSQLLGSQIGDAELLPIKKILLRYSIDENAFLSDALMRRPSILKAQAQIQIQESQIAIAKSSVSPSLSLSFQRQNGDFSYTNVTTNTQNRVFLSISTSFGAGLSNFSQISGAISLREAAEAELEASKRSATEEILADIASLKSSEYRVKASEAACVAAGSTEQSWARQFLAGKKAWQDLLNATRELASCKATLADAKGSLLILNWRLAINAMGLDQSLELATQKF